MGICNVTPDSFCDGGKFFAPEVARARVDALLEGGADIVDIGGESTRPGAKPVAAAEQIARVLEVVRYAAGDRGACVSIDTTDAEVAAACLDAGAMVVNDVSCLRDDALAKVCAGSGAALIVMHTRGTQAEMVGFGGYPEAGYADVVREVLVEWAGAAERAVQLGVSRDSLVMDPGLGFAKSAQQSFELLRRTSQVAAAVGVPVLIGASNKSFLTTFGSGGKPTSANERLGASIAAALHAARAGAAIVRVHDVRATRQALDLDARLRREGS